MTRLDSRFLPNDSTRVTMNDWTLESESLLQISKRLIDKCSWFAHKQMSFSCFGDAWLILGQIYEQLGVNILVFSNEVTLGNCFILFYSALTRACTRPLATGGIPGHWPLNLFVPPNFFVPRKIYFRHIIKTKVLNPKNVFCPQNLKTWLRTWLAHQWLEMSGQFCDSALTRKILDDHDSKGLWLDLTRYSINMSRTHHCCSYTRNQQHRRKIWWNNSRDDQTKMPLGLYFHTCVSSQTCRTISYGCRLWSCYLPQLHIHPRLLGVLPVCFWLRNFIVFWNGTKNANEQTSLSIKPWPSVECGDTDIEWKTFWSFVTINLLI